MPDREILGRIGYMTQSDGIYIELSVWENLRFFAALTGQRDEGRMDEVLEVVDLSLAAQHAGTQPVGRDAATAVAGLRAGSSAVRPLPRRADRGHRSRPPRPVLDLLPEARCGRRHARRQQPRHGRGRSLRRAPADAPRQAARARIRRRDPRSAPARRTSRRRSSSSAVAAKSGATGRGEPVNARRTLAISRRIADLLPPRRADAGPHVRGTHRDHGPARLGHPRPERARHAHRGGDAGRAASAKQGRQQTRGRDHRSRHGLPRRHHDRRSRARRHWSTKQIDIALVVTVDGHDSRRSRSSRRASTRRRQRRDRPAAPGDRGRDRPNRADPSSRRRSTAPRATSSTRSRRLSWASSSSSWSSS